MKVSIGANIKEGPWGGGNLFVINLRNYLEKKGHEVIFDLKALLEKLLELNLGISFLKNPKVAAWVLCKPDYSSLQAAKSLDQKCKFVKKEFDRVANERGITIVYPILDSRDISLFSFENNSNLENLTIFNDRYPSDGWFFCEIFPFLFTLKDSLSIPLRIFISLKNPLSLYALKELLNESEVMDFC